ncbi:cell wall protein RBR3-like [Lycium barbarum]|uniref:cell wall protein RBR3-like n=1 Tax=Lycium barbarum TaxID=112863 RepID=UPI00293E919A|nr:cell wall protein RBR3-like [Lycium barbarum]
MGRRKNENKIGKGKVTAVQIGFIVDRYLSDNSFTETRTTFRSEASHLLAKSPVNEAPRSLLSLGDMLDEYVSLKEQKVFLDQEKCRLDHEKTRLHNLLNGMQHVMNAYNASANLTLPSSIAAASSMPHTGALPSIVNGSSPVTSGYYSAYKTAALMSASRPSNTALDTMKFSNANSVPSTSKRKGFKDVSAAPVTAKRSRKHLITNQLSLKDSSTDAQPTSSAKHNNIVNDSAVQLSDPATSSDKRPVQGSSVVKSLFNQLIQSPPTNSSGPKTPPKASSSQTDKSISPLEVCSTATSSKNITPSRVTATNCTIISSETIRVSPSKQIFYSIERNHCISTSSPVKTNLKRPIRRDQVKSRLDFDAPDNMPCNSEMTAGPDMISTSESEKEGDVFDLDLPNLDALGVDFNLSELLFDFGLDGEGIDYSCQETLHSSPDSFSGSPDESGNVNTDGNQMTSQISSTVTEVFSEQDMNLLGSDSVTTTKSVTKCIQVLSPVKSIKSLRD